jgi:hypothetical protein
MSRRETKAAAFLAMAQMFGCASAFILPKSSSPKQSDADAKAALSAAEEKRKRKAAKRIKAARMSTFHPVF